MHGQNAEVSREEDIFSIDLDSIESELRTQLDENLSELEMLEKEKATIQNPEALGEVVQDMIWNQVCNQIGVQGGKEFIEKNNGMTLDLSDDAHIQTTENFAEGKIATHNTEIDYQERYDEWQSNFQKDENGNIKTHSTRSGNEEATLVKGARDPFDVNRPKGSAEKRTDMDHTVSAGEIIRDAEANAHLSKEEQIKFANSKENLNEMDSSLNRSKGDKSTEEWLDNPNSKGQKPREAFDMSEEEEKELRKKDKEARKKYKEVKEEGKKKSVEAGKKSQRDEAFRIGGQALKTVVLQLLASFVKEVIGKLISWFRSAKRNWETLWKSFKNAVHSFLGNLKTHLINAGEGVLTTIASAIWGPIAGVVTGIWRMLKQGISSIISAIKFIKDPANRKKSFGTLVIEVGKLVIGGLTVAGATSLSTVIKTALMGIPIFAFPIPVLGPLAGIIGILMGSVIAGIIGAVIINWLDKLTAKTRKTDLREKTVEKQTEVLNVQGKLITVGVIKKEKAKYETEKNINERHEKAGKEIKDCLTDIFEKSEELNSDLDDIDADLDALLD